MNKLNLLPISFIFLTAKTLAFGVDVCFHDPDKSSEIIQNCIIVDDTCRTSNLSHSKLNACKVKAVVSSVKGLFGKNTILGGRSLVHSDSTYLMAQLIGFTPWQAYQMMIFDEAVDQAEYTAFDQSGKQILTDTEIKQCQANWGTNMPNHCLLVTPEVNGISKFNFKTGGMLLHWRALYAEDGKKPDSIYYPTTYLDKKAKNDSVLTNFKSWVFGKRNNACAAGITTDMSKINSSCAPNTNLLNSPQNLFYLGIDQLSIHFATNLGELIINQTDTQNTYANDSSLQTYITPDDATYAKLGILLHIIGDHHSHHHCVDNSYFFPEDSGNYTSKYSDKQCAQGKHFLEHVWEQGTQQSDTNLKLEYQTMRPALADVYEQLKEFAIYQGIKVNDSLNKQEIIDSLIKVLQITNPQKRLNAMVLLMQRYNILPLPGHGDYENASIDKWLSRAGAPTH